jgi:hypothetical protein
MLNQTKTETAGARMEERAEAKAPSTITGRPKKTACKYK